MVMTMNKTIFALMFSSLLLSGIDASNAGQEDSPQEESKTATGNWRPQGPIGKPGSRRARIWIERAETNPVQYQIRDKEIWVNVNVPLTISSEEIADVMQDLKVGVSVVNSSAEIKK